jgi:hypothetical protein
MRSSPAVHGGMRGVKGNGYRVPGIGSVDDRGGGRHRRGGLEPSAPVLRDRVTTDDETREPGNDNGLRITDVLLIRLK